MARGRGLAEAPADRLHRPLPVARRRPGDADRGDARRLRDADQAGQGARDRRLQLRRRRASPRRSRRAPPGSCRATRPCSRTTTCTTAPTSRRSSQPLCVKEDVGVIPLLRARLRLPHRQVPDARRTSASSARGGGVEKYLNERGLRILEALDDVSARLQRQARAGRAGLADRPPQHHRPDRQRHHRRAARRPRRRDPPQARRRRHQSPRRRQRVAASSRNVAKRSSEPPGVVRAGPARRCRVRSLPHAEGVVCRYDASGCRLGESSTGMRAADARITSCCDRRPSLPSAGQVEVVRWLQV